MSLNAKVYPEFKGKCPNGDSGKLVIDTIVGGLTCLECGGRFRGKSVAKEVEEAAPTPKKKGK